MNVSTAQHYINGEWVTNDALALAASLNPATGEELGQYSPGNRELTDAAIDAARATFDAGTWAASPRLREKVMLELADRIEAHKDELIELICRENGKLRGEAIFEVMTSISECRFYAGLARNIFGRTLESEPGTFSLLTREPAGVVAVIVPWNAPIILMIRSLMPALAAGCTTVIKPAPQTPLANHWVIERLNEIESLPKGVINSVNEHGAEVGKRLVESVNVDVISFTGSSATGKAIMSAASNTLKRLSLELGGKAPTLVFPDADISKTIPQITRWSLVMSGQMCIAITRILVHEACFDQYRDALSASFKGVNVAPGYLEGSQMGPLIDKPNQQRILDLLDKAEDSGNLIVRGSPLGGEYANGCFVTPSLLSVDDLDSYFVQEEVFGPIVCLEKFSDEADGIRRANATRYGLAASVWTNDLNRAMRVSRALKSGTVWLNAHGKLIAEAETGGYGESGLGRLHGVEALNDCLETKHIYMETQEE